MNTAAQISQSDIVVRLWQEEDFADGKAAWDNLLARSKANPLFMSWSWHRCWWQSYGDTSDQLKIWAAYAHGRLVGLAPFYLEKASYFRNMLPVKRLQFIGKRFNGRGGIRAEYLSLISDSCCSVEVIRALVSNIILSKCWSELNLSDFDVNCESYTILVDELKRAGMYGRHEASGAPYAVETEGEFQDYLAALGKNTRLKLFNRRKLLATMGEASHKAVCDQTIDSFFDQINVWHQQRWGSEAFSQSRKRFLIEICNQSNGDISLRHSSILLLDDEPLSVAINLTAGQTLYNIQLGFKENFDKRIGLGTLHLGYVLEAAYDADEVTKVDFLEGEGKNSNYKSRIAQADGQFESTRWLRPIHLKTLFKFYDSKLRQ